MYRSRKNIVFLAINSLVLLFSIWLSVSLIGTNTSEKDNLILIGVPAIVFIDSLVIGYALKHLSDKFLYNKYILKGETRFIVDYIDRLRFSYTFEDFYQANIDILENKADCGVLFVNRDNDYVLYNSPSRIASISQTRETLMRNFPKNTEDGICYLGDNMDIVSSYKLSRGFLLTCQNYQLFIFCRYTRLFDLDIYTRLYEEFTRFLRRTKTIENLSEISSLTKEWEQLAETQVSFLPQEMPELPHLKVASYYRPLVNVSGDYYTVLPISMSKTFVMLGDVSGKGLPAALIMGLVMNTVKIKSNKEDLVDMIQTVDKAIKGMHLQDKYTVLFMGIIDTDAMNITYVNASMSDPIVITRSPEGHRIKSLASNASLVGIIDMEDTHVSEMKLYRGDMILLASDGVSEVMDDNNVELGDTDLFKDTLMSSCTKSPQAFVDDIVDLIMKYNGDKRLHDDITMLVCKVD